MKLDEVVWNSQGGMRPEVGWECLELRYQGGFLCTAWRGPGPHISHPVGQNLPCGNAGTWHLLRDISLCLKAEFCSSCHECFVPLCPWSGQQEMCSQQVRLEGSDFTITRFCFLQLCQELKDLTRFHHHLFLFLSSARN